MMQRLPFKRPAVWASITPSAGGGFGGATSTPAAVGSPSATGYAENAIARWDCEPYRVLASVGRFGVVAAHMEGIQRVTFSLDGGTWLSIAEESYNTDTGHRAFVVSIDPSVLSDGTHELRAIAYPYSGVPRVLESMYFNANSGGTCTGRTVYVSSAGSDTTGDGSSGNPYQTIGKGVYSLQSNLATGDGGTVIVKTAGTYGFHDENHTGNEISNNYPITIKPDPALAQWAVKISYGAGYHEFRPYVKFLRIRGVVLNIEEHQLYKEDSHHWVMDNVWLTCDSGWSFVPANPIDPIRNQGGSLCWIDCTASNCLLGPTTSNLVRNLIADDISGDLVQNCLCVLGVRCGTIQSGIAGDWHADVSQYFGTVSNVYCRDICVADCNDVQQMFLDHYLTTHRDVAFINCGAYHPDTAGDTPYVQLNKTCRHVLFVNCTFGTQDVYLRDDGGFGFDPTNVVFWNCLCHDIVMGSGGSIPAQVRIDNCHFTGTTKGTNYTSGAVTVAVSGAFAMTYSGAGASSLASGKALPQGLGTCSGVKGARF